MNMPRLQALQEDDAEAWDQVFRWLWPVVLAVAQLRLQPYFPNEAEDVAIEALEELVPKVREVETVEELRPLAASIAHHRAVSLLRERFAQKARGRQDREPRSCAGRKRSGLPGPGEPIRRWRRWSKRSWRNGSAGRSRNLSRPWVKSFQTSIFAVCVTRRLPGSTGWRSGPWGCI